MYVYVYVYVCVCSLEGLMLKLRLQYFGHLTQKADSLEKTLMLSNHLILCIEEIEFVLKNIYTYNYNSSSRWFYQ